MRQQSVWQLCLGLKIQPVPVDKLLDFAGPDRCIGPSVSSANGAGLHKDISSCFEGGAWAHASQGRTCPLRPG